MRQIFAKPRNLFVHHMKIKCRHWTKWQKNYEIVQCQFDFWKEKLSQDVTGVNNCHQVTSSYTKCHRLHNLYMLGQRGTSDLFPMWTCLAHIASHTHCSFHAVSWRADHRWSLDPGQGSSGKIALSARMRRGDNWGAVTSSTTVLHCIA